eukprot:c30359_g1_i1 orf=344-514(-)
MEPTYPGSCLILQPLREISKNTCTKGQKNNIRQSPLLHTRAHTHMHTHTAFNVQVQ